MNSHVPSWEATSNEALREATGNKVGGIHPSLRSIGAPPSTGTDHSVSSSLDWVSESSYTLTTWRSLTRGELSCSAFPVTAQIHERLSGILESYNSTTMEIFHALLVIATIAFISEETFVPIPERPPLNGVITCSVSSHGLPSASLVLKRRCRGLRLV